MSARQRRGRRRVEDQSLVEESYEDSALRAIVSWDAWARAGSHLQAVPRDPLPAPEPGARARVCRGLSRSAQNLCVSPHLARLAAEAAQAPGSEGTECAHMLAEQWCCLWHGGGLGPALLRVLLRTEARATVLALWEEVDFDALIDAPRVELLQASLEVGSTTELYPLLRRATELQPGAPLWRSLASIPGGFYTYDLLVGLCWDVLGTQLPAELPLQQWSGAWAVVCAWPTWEQETEPTMTPGSFVLEQLSWPSDDSAANSVGWAETPTASEVARDAQGAYDLGSLEEDAPQDQAEAYGAKQEADAPWDEEERALSPTEQRGGGMRRSKSSTL